jgi:hypothetical protein
MDDRKFDRIIRSKLEDYHYPVIDHSALDAFHRQNETIHPASWYSRHRTGLIIASGIALLAILYFLGYTLLTRTLNLSEQQSNAANDQKAQIEALRIEVSRLQHLKPDTVRIIEVRTQHSTLIDDLNARIALLEASNRRLMAINERSNAIQSQAGEEMSFNPPANIDDTPPPIEITINKEHQPVQNKPSNMPVKSLSAKSIRALEKHYSNGVGIKLGPSADLFSCRYSLGDKHLSLSGGVLAEFVVSPSFGLEVGIKYSERYYAFTDKHILTGSTLPGVEGQLGQLQGAEVDYQLLEIPLNLKYRYPLSVKDHWIAGIGYSSLIYLNQDFEYTYEFDNQTPNPTSIVSTVSTDEVKAYAGTINFSLGMSHVLKNKKIIEGSLFYNHGIGTQGVEKTRAQYFGLRGTYWFTVR